MQIVINIDEEIFNKLPEAELGSNVIEDILEAVENGTPLPKGHGDLIDRRELKKDVYTTTEWNGDVHRIIYESSVDHASTIIEADKDCRDCNEWESCECGKKGHENGTSKGYSIGECTHFIEADKAEGEPQESEGKYISEKDIKPTKQPDISSYYGLRSYVRREEQGKER